MDVWYFYLLPVGPFSEAEPGEQRKSTRRKKASLCICVADTVCTFLQWMDPFEAVGLCPNLDSLQEEDILKDFISNY